VSDNVEKLSKFLLEIITLVSSVNKMGSDKIFTLEAGHLYKRRGPEIDPWGTPCFIAPHFEENFTKDFNSVFLFPICQIGCEPVSYCSLSAIIM
jgi:hypothetical protein